MHITPKVTPENPNIAYDKRILELIEAGDVPSLNSLLVDINTLLTGGDFGDFSKNSQVVAQRMGKLEIVVEAHRDKEWAYEEFSLGDAGLSRIFLGTDEGVASVFLSTSSTPQVLDKWERLISSVK